MKKFFISILILMAAVSFAAAYGAEAPVTVTGTIKYYGSAPHAFPGLVTKEGQEYTLDVQDGVKFTVKDIASNQGKLIKVTGVIVKKRFAYNQLKDGTIYVSEYKVSK